MVAINCDMGEAFSIYRCGDDEGLMPLDHRSRTWRAASTPPTRA